MTSEIQRAIELLRSGNTGDAQRLLQYVCIQTPNDADAWAWQGILYARQKNYDEAERCTRRSIKLQPEDPGRYRTLGDILAMRHKFTDAVDVYRTSLSINPDQAEIYTNLSQCMKEVRRIPEAIDAGLKALELNPAQLLAHRNLGLLYEMLHRTDDARMHAQAALDLNSADIESHILLAILDSREGDHVAAMRRLQQQLDTCLEDSQRAILNLELGKILDRLGDYQKAFRCMEEGNRLLGVVHGITVENTAAFRADIERYSRFFTPDRIKEWLSGPFPEQPVRLVFLVGFPRSGTTLTEQILESHDEVVATDELPVLADTIRNASGIIGRPFHYPEDTGHLNDVDIEALRIAYLDNIRQGLNTSISKGAVILDKLPLNIVHLGFIIRIFPEARILVALRDPRDVCLSCYMQAFDMNTAMAQFLDLEDTGRFYACVMTLWQQYRAIRNLPVLETRYEDVVDDLEGSARRLLGFCGLEWNRKVLDFHTRAKQRLVRTPSYQAIARPVYSSSIGKWKNYADELQPLMESLDPFIDAFNYRA
jgi:tetratricopeptide (TPR) repeat protein